MREVKGFAMSNNLVNVQDIDKIDNIELRDNFLIIHYTQGESIELNLSRSTNGERQVRFRGTELLVSWSQQSVIIESNDLKITVPRSTAVIVGSSAGYSHISAPNPPTTTPSQIPSQTQSHTPSQPPSQPPSPKSTDSKFLDVV